MGRGPVIQARKEAVNMVKGKIFSFHSKLISLAAQKGGNVDDNPSLFSAIHAAKKDGVPNENIERAIKKGTGEDKDSEQISEIIYEGYAPGGISVMISTLTDNKNRTVSSIRHIFSQFGGNMGESGSVSWMFHRRGVIFIDTSKYNFSDLEDLIYETNAEDLINEENYIKIITSIENFVSVLSFLEGKKIEIMESKIDFIPDNYIEITEFEKALKFKKMLEAFAQDEDVNVVSTNEIISLELEKQVVDFIEKNTFRT